MDAQQLYGTRAWQVQGWDAYDTVPENHSTTAFIAACLSRLRFRLAWLGDDDEPGPVWDEEGKVREGINPAAAEVGRALVRTLRARIGGQSRLLAKIGANLAQVGDLYLVPREGNGRRYFDAYSIDELRPNSDGTYTRYGGPGRSVEVLAKTEDGKAPLVIRVHREHPRFSEWADSPTRSLLGTLEVMDLLVKEMRSSTVSRVIGPGLVFLSDEIDLPPDPNDPDNEGLTAHLVNVASTAIANPGSAAASVPVFIRASPEAVKDGVKQVKFAEDDRNTIPKRDAAVATFARGSDLPVEQVTGTGAANHWGAWMIDESTAKIYIAPVMEIVDAILTDAYLLPSFSSFLKRDPKAPLPPEYANFVVHYDDANLVTHPDRSASAAEAFGTARQPNFGISEQAYRGAKGFPESAAPDDEEIERRMAWAERLNARVTVGAPMDEGTGLPDEQGPSAVQPGPPAAANNADQTQDGTAAMQARIAAAVEVAAERAVDRLGSRLRSAVDAKAPDLRSRLSGLPSREVPLALGSAVSTIIPVEQQYVGEFAALERTVTRWMNGTPGAAQVGQRSALAAEALARALAENRDAHLDTAALATILRGA